MTYLPHQQSADGLQTVGDYTLLAKIGEGGMGVVHLARRPDGERVALKVLRQHIVGDDEARARLAREVSSLSRIRSRWVAEILDADPWAPIPYVATRYVPGLSLHDQTIEDGPIRGAELSWLGAGLAEGIASVHATGVLHRDVKPSNVLMEGRTPILIDFGLARVADDPKLTHTGWLLGTPGYLAPEILYGEDATAASDVHSWAATVAYAGLGRAPFGRGPSMAIMDRVRRGEHDLEEIDGELREVLEEALDPDPGQRPTLEEITHRLRPDVTRVRRVVPRPEPAPDPFTLPLAMVAEAAAEAPTDRVGAPETRVETEHDPQPAGVQLDRWGPYDDHYGPDRPWSQPGEQWTHQPPPPLAERLRRGTLLAITAVGVGAGTAAAPWIALTGVSLLVWLLRSGSLAASSIGDRRRLRGARWYDGIQFLLGAPWHLIRSIPATLVLIGWSLGLGVAAALICYAVAAGIPLTLFLSGVVVAVSLWCGPGGSRVRSPLARVVEPVSERIGPWLVGLVAVLAITGTFGSLATVQGPDWSPGTERPFSSDAAGR